jgi:hypothetical protein
MGARGTKHYAAGTRFEHKVMDDLVSRGWVCLRAAGSKGSTKIDVIAFKPGFPQLMIQCKTSGTISKAEWDRIYEVAGWYGTQYHPRPAIPVLAMNGPNGRGVTYMEITGERIMYARSQPWRELILSEEEVKIPQTV